jgi:hypothetical protein
MTDATRVITQSKTPRTRSKGEKKISLGETGAGCGCAPLRLKRALYVAKALCKMSAAVERRTTTLLANR